MKRCSTCGEDDQRAFTSSRKTICKPCAREYHKAWQLANPEKNRAISTKWRRANPEKSRSRQRKWREENLGKSAAHKKKWREENPAKVNTLTAKRRASKLQRTPVWADTAEEALAVEKLYRLAQEFTRASGVPYEVDHVLPMQGLKVSGLHLAANMEVTTRWLNRTKSNRYEP